VKSEGTLNVEQNSPLFEQAELTDGDFQKISRLIHEQAGICLSEGKEALVKSRLGKSIREGQFGSFRNYYEHVVNDTSGKALVQLLDSISTNFTSFFREEKHFDFLRSELLPELMETKRNREKKLRIWSAGCSSGEEPYSIAITLLEAVKSPSIWEVTILATDISTKVLRTAESGVFHKDRVNSIPSDLLKKCFLKGERRWKDHVRIKDWVREHVRFERLNLMHHFTFNEPFDCIFCRNVMIYFDKKTRGDLVNRFYQCLEKGGAFLIGHSESLSGIQHPFRYVKPAVYRK
jgi:chemotaxis protein methyltransferase CheR